MNEISLWCLFRQMITNNQEILTSKQTGLTYKINIPFEDRAFIISFASHVLEERWDIILFRWEWFRVIYVA